MENIGIPIKILKLPETEFRQRKRKFGTDVTNFAQISNSVPVSGLNRFSPVNVRTESGFPVQQVYQQKSQKSQTLSQGC